MLTADDSISFSYQRGNVYYYLKLCTNTSRFFFIMR